MDIDDTLLVPLEIIENFSYKIEVSVHLLYAHSNCNSCLMKKRKSLLANSKAIKSSILN